jgi:hypothetical protein
VWDAEVGAVLGVLPVSVVQPSAVGGFGTGGDAYLAAQPQDILGVFARAVLSR